MERRKGRRRRIGRKRKGIKGEKKLKETGEKCVGNQSIINKK